MQADASPGTDMAAATPATGGVGSQGTTTPSPSRGPPARSTPASPRACPSTGAPALLAPVGSGSSCIVLARAGSRLPSTLSLFGCNTRAFLVDGRSFSPGCRIPVPSNSVDHLFTERGLRSEATGWGGAQRDHNAVEAFLRECRRVLRPGGTLTVVERGHHRVGPHGSRRVLERSGFGAVRAHIPWPAHGDLVSLVCRARVNRTARFEYHGKRRTLRIAGPCYRLLQRFGLHLPLLPELYFVAEKRVGSGSESSVRELHPSALARILAREAPAARIERLAVGFRASTSTLTLRAGSRFVKIPLTPDGVDRLEAEERALGRLRSHPLAAHTLTNTRFTDARGVPYVSAPFIDDRSSTEGTDDAVASVLRMFAGDGGESTPLCGTATWRRVAQPPSSSPWGRIAGDTALAELLRDMGRCRVPVGISHGDFHAENVLVDRGRAVIIDWDRFEEPAPLFLDPISDLFHRLCRPAADATDWRAAYLARIDRLMRAGAGDAQAEGPAGAFPGSQARALLGELGWRRAATFYVASYAERWATSVLASGAWDEAATRAVCEERFDRCARWMKGA